jgi:ribosomal protein S18 acetylase RimI-like enzyme
LRSAFTPELEACEEEEMPKKVLIRPAQPEDAPVVAQLMYYASSSYMLAFFGRPESRAIGVLRRMFSLPRHTTSYTYAFVAEYEGDIVGSFSGFDGKSWRVSARASWLYGPIWFAVTPPWQIPRMIAAFGDFNKAMPLISNEEYHIGHLAVLPEKRRQGIGKQLIEFAENQARAKGLKRVTLSVEVENEGARRLYERLGFQTIEVVADPSYCRRFNFQGSIRMAKPI